MITQEQRLARMGSIGSSDMAAILGVDPWRSAYDVYLSKKHPLDDIANSEPIDIGNTFEAPLLDWAAETLGMEIEKDVSIQGLNPFAANLDGRVLGKPIGIEAKTTSSPGDFGNEFTDEVPNRVIVQCNHQMMVADLDHVFVPVLMAQFDRLTRKMFKVGRSEELIKIIRSKGEEFWDCVKSENPPAAASASLDVIKRIARVAGDVAVIDPSLAEAFEDAKAAKKEAEKIEEKAKAALIAALGDSEAGVCGEALYTFYQQSRSQLDAKRLRANHPHLVGELEKTSTFRVLRRKNL